VGTHLSGGEKSAGWPLCKVLMQEPDLLLLDEPTNHLDAETVAMAAGPPGQTTPEPPCWSSHDRYFLNQVAQWILEMEKGQRLSPGRATTAQLAGAERSPTGLQREERELPADATIKREMEWVWSCRQKARQV
jgi:sulfate-transporting ATPase